MGVQSVDDSLKLFAVLRLDVRQVDGLRSLAKEGPVLAGIVHERDLLHPQKVLDFQGEQVSMLKPELRRRALQVDEDPAVLLGLAKRSL